MLQKLTTQPLTFDEAVTHLLDGKILIGKEVEQTRKGDALVRLDRTQAVPLTQISYNTSTDNTEWSGRYWATFDVSFNLLAMYTFYLFTEDYDPNLYVSVGDNLYYVSDTSVLDGGVVQEVYRDTDSGEILVKLSLVNYLIPVTHTAKRKALAKYLTKYTP